MPKEEQDAAIRQAAFDHVRQLSAMHGTIEARHLSEGFTWRGRRLPLINPRGGIFKPKEMSFLLSIRTVYPKSGTLVRYDDQRTAHEAIYRGDETVSYSFMGKDPEAPDNRLLREATLNGVPILYFLGVAPSRYQAIQPTYLLAWDPMDLTVQLAFSEVGRESRPALSPAPLPDAPERRYAMRLVKQRLHQATFRERLLKAYRGRCAISGLPERRLIDAAHIVPDPDEKLGQPLIANGLPLSKIHHAAFDAHLIGIDPDYRIHISEELLAQHDGPLLEHALKGFDGKSIREPRLMEHRPDRDRLAQRFELFLKAA